MGKREKTFWPVGISLVILFGVVLLYFLVRISMQQSTAPDGAYDQTKFVVDTRINDFLQIQRDFESSFLPYVAANGIPDHVDENRVYTPYFTKRSHVLSYSDDGKLDESKQRLSVLSGESDVVFMSFRNVSGNSDVVVDSIELELNSLQSAPKERDRIFLSMHRDGDIYATDAFSLPRHGVYQGVFRVTFTKHGRQEKVFYKRSFFNLKGNGSVRSTVDTR